MYKDRAIYPALEGQLENQKITFLIGARQVGKTTLMRRLYEEVRAQHRAREPGNRSGGSGVPAARLPL